MLEPDVAPGASGGATASGSGVVGAGDGSEVRSEASRRALLAQLAESEARVEGELEGAEAALRDLSPLAAGDALLAFAHGEPAARHDLRYVGLKAERKGAGYVLSGNKAVVLHGGQAQQLIVSARSEGETRSESGVNIGVGLSSATSRPVRRRYRS